MRFFIWRITLCPVWLCLLTPNIRRYLFKPVSNFSGCGQWASRWVVMPKWALVIYCLWHWPNRIYWQSMTSRSHKLLFHEHN